MTELDTLKRAKTYMDKLAQGIDPISGAELPEDSLLNNVRLARCFFYVSGILGKVIQNGGDVTKKPKQTFFITEEQLKTVEISKEPVRITEFMDILKAAAGNVDAKRPRTTLVTDWLLEKGFMQLALDGEGKKIRIPTEAGNRLGIHAVNRQGINGVYTAVLYDANAQQFILDNFDSIMHEKQ